MKSDIGYNQEELPSGKIASSSIRIMSFIALGILVGYLVVANISFEHRFDRYVELMKSKTITEQSFNTLVLELKRFDWDIVVILLVAAFVPKAIQKFAEAKTGIKDSTETTTTTKITSNGTT